MDSKILYRFLSGFILLIFSYCVSPYDVEVVKTDNSFLTVNGFINSKGITEITLSRTLNLSDSGKATPESNAQVFIEDEQGEKSSLNETGAGTYLSALLTLDKTRKYRLSIKTTNGKEYASDFVPVLETPEIDSISWKVQSDGLQIYVNSHDTKNATRYYRWDYEDTWEFTSLYNSVLMYVPDTVVTRTDDIYHCWTSDRSNEIDISNSLKLEQDIISEYPLHFLPSNSVKLRYKYSILVKQYAQSEEEYQYWETLQKNTENIGSMYDPLPSRLLGNIHCLTNPDETVIGFTGAYGVTEKRIFISNEQLPAEWEYQTGYEDCDEPMKMFLSQVMPYIETGQYIPIYPFFSPAPFFVLQGYYIGTKECTDCRLRGTNVKPTFWQ
ncbi:DUF4249 domain-containing protein [Rubrolithibacter danxiaensis]|uniref:DUF4249 domain-containing protein n=1 Tax=Rubrolithibacter danxiaensis TaxID=3390805 RepID=UPI003BF87497